MNFSNWNDYLILFQEFKGLIKIKATVWQEKQIVLYLERYVNQVRSKDYDEIKRKEVFRWRR